MFVVVTEVFGNPTKERRVAVRVDDIELVGDADVGIVSSYPNARSVIIRKQSNLAMVSTDSFDDVMAAIHDVGYCVVGAGAPRARTIEEAYASAMQRAPGEKL